MKNKKTIVLLAAIFLFVILGCNRGISTNTTQSFTNTNTNSNTNTERVKTDAEIKQEKLSNRSKWVNDKAEEFSKLPAKSSITKSPYIKGLVVAYEQDDGDKEFSSADSYIPTDDLKALTADEVGTIILIKNKNVFYGNYTVQTRGKIPSYVLTSEVIIIDNTIPAVIYRKTFRGAPPSDEVMVSPSDDSIEGDSPDDKVNEFLEKLPRK
jgi:hypothetical protein